MVQVGALFFSDGGVACVHGNDALTFSGVQCSGCSSVLSKQCAVACRDCSSCLADLLT